MNKSTDPTTNVNKIFTWIAWVLAFALLVFAFQDYIDKQWNPNVNPEQSFDQQGRKSVTLKRNKQGHYVTLGSINNENVIFLLDTGATQVSIPQQVAERLQLERLGNYPVQTANGTATVYRTHIDTLSIGDILLQNVDAHINPNMQGDEILLGMSALKRVEFRQRGNELILTEYNVP